MSQRTVLLNMPQGNSLDIEFEDVSYAAKNRSEKKLILDEVSGSFRSGELTAIMGPSGAGKTTLLNILTGYLNKGIKGTIRASGDTNIIKYRKECCYILQDDQLPPLFTVRELMVMAANLKIGDCISKQNKEILIEEILETIGLTTASETRCQRLSGGQKKRLSVALELIDNPHVMFLDEPTTGLDSLSSFQCITMLKNLARGGRTIICTIHQPSATIFEMFDHVYVLAAGKCLYQGSSQNVVEYLSTFGYNCPQYHNPADYLLEVANLEYGNIDRLLKATCELKWRNIAKTEKVAMYEKKIEESAKGMVFIQPPSEWVKLGILVNRSFTQTYRDWTIFHLRLLLHALIGLFLGCFYYNIGNDASQTVANVSYYIVSAVYLTYTSLMPAVLKFPNELPVLKKERFNNWYKLKTYYIAFIVQDIPLHLAFSLIYTASSYYLSAQPSDYWRFLLVVGVLFLVSIVASSLGILIGTLGNPVNGTFFGAILTAFFLVLAGFLILFTHMNKAMYYLSFTSFLSYSYAAMVLAAYGFDRDIIPCPETVDYCHLRDPSMIIRELGLEECNYWGDIAVLIFIVLIFKVSAFCTLKRSLSVG